MELSIEIQLLDGTTGVLKLGGERSQLTFVRPQKLTDFENRGVFVGFGQSNSNSGAPSRPLNSEATKSLTRTGRSWPGGICRGSCPGSPNPPLVPAIVLKESSPSSERVAVPKTLVSAKARITACRQADTVNNGELTYSNLMAGDKGDPACTKSASAVVFKTGSSGNIHNGESSPTGNCCEAARARISGAQSVAAAGSPSDNLATATGGTFAIDRMYQSWYCSV